MKRTLAIFSQDGHTNTLLFILPTESKHTFFLLLHPMSEFSDAEDIYLFQLCMMFQNGGKKICWDYVAKMMPKYSRVRLQGRLKTLKQTNGLNLYNFPVRFFRSPLSLLPLKKKKRRGGSLYSISDGNEIFFRPKAVDKFLVAERHGSIPPAEETRADDDGLLLYLLLFRYSHCL